MIQKKLLHFHNMSKKGLSRPSEEWIPLQIKTFSRWVADHLRGNSDYTVTDITKDLKNGVALVELAKILTGKDVPRRWVHSPKSNYEMVQNCDLALEMFKGDGVNFVSISGKDVNDNNEKLILGLVWTLILHYLVGNTVRNEDEVMTWAIHRTANYANVRDFSPYGLSMCALLDSYYPQKINYNSLNPKDSEHNAQLAQRTMIDLGIPVYVDPEDIDNQSHIDQKALITQLSSMRAVLEAESSNLKIKERTVLGAENSNLVIKERSAYISEQSLESNDDSEQFHQQALPFISKPVDGDNSQYTGRKFGLIMTLNESDYNEGKQMIEDDQVLLFGNDVDFALTLEKDGKPFLNPAGARLNLAEPDIEHDVYQQFTFGKGTWNTVIDSFVRKGMVWDVADADNLDPPAGTPFYMFPFHGRHNQHFVYKDGLIYAKQNGMVVTYIGGDIPFQMMPPSAAHKARQTFKIQLL